MFNIDKLYRVLKIIELGIKRMKNIFITGGSGLVGGYVLDHFLKKKFRVLTTVRSMKSKNYSREKI